MRHTIETLALGSLLAAALAACATTTGNPDMSGSNSVNSTMSGPSAKDYDGLHNNNGNGEAGATPMPGSLGATSGEQIQQ